MQKLSQIMLVTPFFVFIMAYSIARAALQEGEPPPPALPQIPGVTAPDRFPRGCVDCHVNRPDLKMDVRISTLLLQWQIKVDPELLVKVREFSPAGMPLKGMHPKIEGELTEIVIPDTCLQCHAKTSKSAPPLGRLLHGLHLVGGEQNHFLTVFQGECTHCHKLDAATGSWSLGSGVEKE